MKNHITNNYLKNSYQDIKIYKIRNQDVKIITGKEKKINLKWMKYFENYLRTDIKLCSAPGLQTNKH